MSVDSRKSGIRVKVLTRTPARIMRRQLPLNAPVWGNCEFCFDWNERDYDWLVVYDDLPPVANERRSRRCEPLSCPRERTILVTTEPESIKSYFTGYTSQFGQVLTSQPDWALPHSNRIYQQPGLRWFYGVSSDSVQGYDQLSQRLDDGRKSNRLGTVCSVKQQTHTLHDRRYRFTQELKALISDLDVFGRGVCEIDDKAESIAPFKYHLAIENHLAPHHWTEKLSDPFLGEALPFYVGAPNANDYFPEQSFIVLNINNPTESADIIRRAIENDEYSTRKPAILEAKRRVLEQHNLFAVLSNYIEKSETYTNDGNSGLKICSRRVCIEASFFSKLQHLYQKLKLRWLTKKQGKDLAN